MHVNLRTLMCSSYIGQICHNCVYHLTSWESQYTSFSLIIYCTAVYSNKTSYTCYVYTSYHCGCLHYSPWYWYCLGEVATVWSVAIVTVTGSTDQPTITWLDPAMNNMITSGVVTTGSMSTLTFNQLASSQASGAAVASGESEVSGEYEGPDRTVRTGWVSALNPGFEDNPYLQGVHHPMMMMGTMNQ